MKRLVIFCIVFFASVSIFAQDELPEIRIHISNNPSDGYIYIATLRRNIEGDNTAPRHLLLINNEGEIAYQKPIGRVFNFGRASNGLRYYFDFTDNGPGRGASNDGVYRMIDDAGETVHEYTIQGDYPTQSHEFLYLDNGHVMLLSQPLMTVDMTEYGGHPEALVSEALIQEQDADGNVIWEWRSWEHVAYTDTSNHDELKREPPEAVSYMHVNAFTRDLDGNLILSARRFDELIKLDYETGDILWRMGGQHSRNNEFVFIDDPLAGFTGQHHVQVLENGNIILFDNGNANEDHPARAVEYVIDEENRTATLVWSFEDVRGRSTGAMGSVQRLENGNTLIGWGTAPPNGANVTEVTPDGEIVLALSLPSELVAYRVYRYQE